MLKTILITTFVALFLSLLLPAVLGVLAATVFSGLSILDPLYAGERSSGARGALGGFLVVQTLHVVLSAPLTAAGVQALAGALRSRWLYPLAALLGAVVHAVLTPLYLRGQVSLLPAADAGPLAVWLVLLAFLVGPVIGLLAAWAARSGAAE
jgi:hypothetical protein